MKKFLSYSFFLLIFLVFPAIVHAAGSSSPNPASLDFTDFAVFGDHRVQLGRGTDVDPEDPDPDNPDDPTTINGGLTGSNGDMRVFAKAQTQGLYGQGELNGGREVNVNGDVVFNDNVMLYTTTHVTGDVDSGKDLKVGKNATIDGNATSGGSFDLSSGVVIGGSQHPGGTPEVFTPVTLPSETIFGAGSMDVHSGAGDTITLLPGSYDDINLGRMNVLNLTAGKYYMDTFHLGLESVINIDLSGGQFELYVVKDITIGRETDMFLTNGDADDVYMEAGRNWRSYSYSTLYGTVYAHNNLVLGRKNDFTGALYSGHNLTIYSGSTINFDLNCNFTDDGCTTQSTAVPEPGTMALLGSGLLGAFGLRRKKI